MAVDIKIQDHLILPFGKPKWSINDIKVSGVSTDGTYFTSTTPCAYINKTKKEPLRLEGFKSYFPEGRISNKCYNALSAWSYMRDLLIKTCCLDTVYEEKFLQIYFAYIKDYVLIKIMQNGLMSALGTTENEFEHIDVALNWKFGALMPFPQAHIYARDPFIPQHEASFIPERMFKVDFVFWTGDQIIAIEIDGSSHIGSSRHIEKDRMLSRSGVHVIHIRNEELDDYKEAVIPSLLPSSISQPPFADISAINEAKRDDLLRRVQSPYSNPFAPPEPLSTIVYDMI